MKNHILLPVLSLILLVLNASCDDDTDDRSKFIGRYEVTEFSLETFTQRDDYEVRIRKDTGTEDMVIISNFYNLDIDATAIIQGNSITVMQQEHGIFKFEGTGSLQGSIITLNYTVSSTSDDPDYYDRLRAEMTFME